MPAHLLPTHPSTHPPTNRQGVRCGEEPQRRGHTAEPSGGGWLGGNRHHRACRHAGVGGARAGGRPGQVCAEYWRGGCGVLGELGGRWDVASVGCGRFCRGAGGLLPAHPFPCLKPELHELLPPPPPTPPNTASCWVRLATMSYRLSAWTARSASSSPVACPSRRPTPPSCSLSPHTSCGTTCG